MRGPSPAALLLREARERAAISQRDMAELARTSQSVVGRIEAGHASPSLETLEQLIGAAGFALRLELVPHPVVDPVVEAFKEGIDRTLLIENLRRSVDERLRMNADVQYFTDELRRGLRVAEGDS